VGIKTPIEWCDSTLNLQMGCDGCELRNLAAAFAFLDRHPIDGKRLKRKDFKVRNVK
jgi:hypothetical protein